MHFTYLSLSAGNYTVFAPTDQAFTKILQALPVVTADDQTFKSKCPSHVKVHSRKTIDVHYLQWVLLKYLLMYLCPYHIIERSTLAFTSAE